MYGIGIVLTAVVMFILVGGMFYSTIRETRKNEALFQSLLAYLETGGKATVTDMDYDPGSGETHDEFWLFLAWDKEAGSYALRVPAYVFQACRVGAEVGLAELPWLKSQAAQAAI